MIETKWKKEVENDTYYLIELQINTDDKEITPLITFTNTLDENWIYEFQNTDFAERINKMLTECFPEVKKEDIIEYLNRPRYTNYLMFSQRNLLKSHEYYLIAEEFEPTMIKPQAFCSIETVEPSSDIMIKKAQTMEWEPTRFYKMYNICKSNEVKQKGICTSMINIIVNQYDKYPIFLYVRENNEAAITCYMNNHFQKVVNVFDKPTAEPEHVLRHGTENIYMCYNKYTLQLEHENRTYQLSPSNKKRFAFVAHGALTLQADAPFVVENFNYKNYEEEIYYPFENLQFYVPQGQVLLGNNDESNAIFDVCYENVFAREIMVPTNKYIKLIPMFFSGYNAKTDPENRKGFIGLYDCNMKKRVKENHELFGEGSTKQQTMQSVFKHVYKYCVENDVNPSNVEMKIYACRSLCQVGDYAMRAKDNAFGATPDEMVGGNTPHEEEFEAVDKQTFYNFLVEQESACIIPVRKPSKKSRSKKSRQTVKRTQQISKKRTQTKK